jgi:hypothetical protein
MGGRDGLRTLVPWTLVLGVLAPGRAAAQSTVADLTLAAPESCPDELVLEQEVASLVGGDAAAIPLPAGLDPHITITRDRGRFVLEVHVDDATRTLRDGSCSALVRAAALIIALRVDADAATLAAATAAEPPPPPPPPADDDVLPPARRRRYALEWSGRLASPVPPPRLPVFGLGAGVVVESGIVPVISASIAIDAVVRADRFETRVRAAYVLEQGQPTSVGVSAAAILATLLGCGRPFEDTFPLALCGGLEAGQLIARSYGVAYGAQSTPWTMSGVAGLWLPLTPWRGIDVSLGVEVWARFYRPQFVIEGLGHVWDSDLLGGRFALLVNFSP